MKVRRSRKTEVFKAVEIGVIDPDRARALGVALRIGVEHILQQDRGGIVHRLEADDGARDAHVGGDLDGALGDVLGEIADALEIVGNADRRDDFAQIDRQRLAPRDRQDRLLLDLALQSVEARIGC